MVELAVTSGALVSRLPMFGPCVCSLFAGLAGLTQLIVKVCELITQAGRTGMKVSRLVPSVRGTFPSLSRFARGALGLGLGFGA